MTRRVIVGLDPTPTGGNALWTAVEQARRRGALLFIVQVRPTPRPVPPLPPPAAERLQPEAQRQAADALLLTVGGPPSELDIRVAVVYGHPSRVLPQLADRPDDLLIIGDPPRPWRRHRSRSHRVRYCRAHSRAELLVATDPTTSPLPAEHPPRRSLCRACIAQEESGVRVRASHLVGGCDRKRWGHQPPFAYHMYKRQRRAPAELLGRVKQYLPHRRPLRRGHWCPHPVAASPPLQASGHPPDQPQRTTAPE